MQRTAASAVYEPTGANVLQDEPLSDHYRRWGYSIGYEMDGSGQPVPESGNTAVFRIFPHSMTEPVFVTKPEEDATFTVNVLAGKGELIRARADGKVENLFLEKGTEVVVRPGEAYFYRNIDQFSDLVLHDVALPAFQPGDDVELTSSYITEQSPRPEDGRLTCVAKTPSGETVTVDLPEEFYEAVGYALRPPEKATIEDLNGEIKFDAAVALGGLAMLGVGLYANYSEITGKNNGFNLLSWPSGLTSMGAAFSAVGIKGLVSSIRKRRFLKRAESNPDPIHVDGAGR